MATSPTPPSSSLPQPLSYEQILGQELSTYARLAGVDDLNAASVNVSFMQLVALVAARSSGDIFQILRDFNLSRATGPALQNLAIEYGVPPIGAAVTTGFITVVDLSFQKIATKIYAGANPPIAGSTTIFVSDASLFPASGSLYLGRGSVNIEGPISYGTMTVSATGNTVILSNVIGGLSSTASLIVGFPISGLGIAPGTIVSSIDSSSQIHISIPATANGTGTVFTFSTPPVKIGSFWEISLDNPTTKFHNISESVILAQGGVRTVPVNTVVVSPGVGTSPTIQFSVTQNGIILDGETTVTNIPVTAQLPGAAGNVPAGAVSQFSGNPPGLPNASVTNPLAFTTGRDTETDDQLRVRVKNKLASTGLGTVLSIESALAGVQDPNSSATIVSTDILNSSSDTIVYIDNGSGYEATHAGVPIETIVNSALGGEKFFQLVTGGKQTSVTKAMLQTVASEPFNLSGGEHLTVVVGDVTYDHIFASTDFANPGSATAYEICASINADTLLNYEAVTAGNGTFVVIRPEDETTNIIQITTPASTLVIDANTILQFPSQKAETLRLYKNGLLLIEDGTTASIFTQSQGLWSPTLASGETLSLSIDGTAPITYTLTDAQFVAEGTYTTLSYSNSPQSWVNVLNNNITGITASIVGSTIELTSNLGPINRAEITVVNTISHPTSLISKGFISNTDLSSIGVKSDYILDRNTAQIQLATALVKNDTLSAGTIITQANIEAVAIPSGSVTLTSDAHVWISIDTSDIIIPTIISGSTLSVSKISPNVVRYTTNSPSAFSNVLPGDYVIVWSTEIPSTDRLEGRVHAASGSVLDIKITAAEYALATPVTNASFVQGFVVVRTANVPQKFRVLAGTKTLDVIAAELQTQTDELTFGVFDNTNITIVDNTLDTIGQITVVTADLFGSLIGFSGKMNSVSQDALIAFYETKATTAELPLFFHSTISADSYAEPIDSYLTNFSSTLSLSSFDPNELIQFLNPYGTAPSISGGSSPPSPLASAASFALLGASAVTNTGASTITGDVGVAPGTSITPGGWTVIGTIHNDDATAITAQADALTAFNAMQILGLAGTTIAGAALDGQTLTPGAYQFSSGAATLATSGPGTLTFNGAGVYIIYTASTLTTGAGGLPTMTLSGGATAANIFFVVGSSATINVGTPGVFQGNIIAQASVTDTTGGTVNGSLIALTAAVTLSAASIVNAQSSSPVPTLTLVSGTGDATITFSAFTVPVPPSQFTFTVTSANATAGAVYSSNGMFFTVVNTIVAGTTLVTTGIGLIDDEQPSEETVQMSALAGTSVTILPEYPDVRRLRISDRYYVANPLDFGYNDTVVAIVDNNTVGETYTLPLYRRAIVNSIWPANSFSFDAYDVDAGATASFATNFTGFDFSNFKVLMQPKFVLQGANTQTALLLRSVLFGRSGEDINVSYVYPTSANQPISSVVTINNSVNIMISLLSGNPITSSIAANTQWNVTVTPNTPTAGIDQVTYTWAGQYLFTIAGTPNQYTFTVTSANATIGDVYSNNGQSFTVNSTIVAGTTLTTTGTGTPLASGTLTKVSGSGDATITFSAFTNSGANATAGATYTNNGQTFTVVTTITAGTLLTTTSSGGAPTASGTLTKTSGTGDATIAFPSFTFVGLGSNPSLSLSGGEYVTILPSTGFNIQDTGTFRVSTAIGFTPTATSFSVQVPTGTAVAQSGVLTTVLNGINFFTATPTTAAALNTYINANLSKYLTSTIVNDGGMTGSGVIVLSTFEGSGFSIPSYFLKDGINWIASSNVTGNPQFTLKKPLSYVSDTGYSFFTSGEEVRLIPTTMDQVKDLWNILAVTGFTTVGTVEVVDRGTKLQLATNTIGSGGSIQIVGGTGNGYSVPVLTSGELIGNGDMVVSANGIASEAMASDQWFRLQAQNYQTKDTGISNNTSVTVLSNTPIGGESTVTLLNQESGQLYFGAPRSGIRVEGDTFRIEKQGSLACLSWNGVGTSPGFSSSINFNSSGGGLINVSSSGVYSIPSPPPSSFMTTLMGTSAGFAILGSSTVTSTGATAITGDLGLSPGTSVTGFPPGTVSGVQHITDSIAANAQAKATTAYNTLASLAPGTVEGTLDGLTLTPGTYTSGSTMILNVGQTLILSGAGQYIFQLGSALTIGNGSTISLIGGATAANIVWQVGSSATIGTTAVFEGNIFAQASITVNTGASVNGSLIALTGAVSLDDNAVSASTTSSPGNINFSALSVGDVITISGMANPGNNGTFVVTGIAPNGLSFTVANPSSVIETGTSVLSGAFSATSSVSEGDTLILSSPFAPLNQGEYRVVRRFNDSVWYENPNVVEEEVTCTADVVSTGFDSTSVFNVNVVGGTETLVWNGVGTPPLLGLALPGDTVTFGAGFIEEYVFTIVSGNATAGATYTNNSHTFTVVNTIVAGTTLVTTGTANPTAFGVLTKTSGSGDATIAFSSFTTNSVNQGSFTVVGSGPSQQQIVQLTLSSGITFSSSGPGDYFEIYNGGNANQYYIWYNVLGGSNTDPAPVGFTGIEVSINSGDTAATVAAETFTAINGFLVAMTSSHVASTNVVTVTATIAAATNPPLDVSMPSAFGLIVTQLGQTSFLSVINPSAVPQSSISSVTFSIDRPQIQFFPYEATVPGDKLIVNGSVLGSGNAGTYKILQILSPSSVIISGVISQQFATNLAGNSISLSVQEGTKYTGYKQVLYVSAQPGISNFNNIVFNTSAQYQKIDLSANVAMVALGKLNFPTSVRNGIDSYNYDTGLIGEANRVVYGDPRDSITYSGVNAAGTDIYIREPLLRRIKISLAVRTNIGISFTQITNQIQSSVYALIQSNPLGQSIDLSSIVETVRLIPGITSVVLISPTYTVASDEIQLVTGEKAFIADQVTDISVALIGS